MRSSFDEAFARDQEPSAMSARGPSNPLGDRPRMAEALASLKEGLRDTADPLYDSWKLRQVASERPVVLDVEGDAGRVSGASPEAHPAERAPRSANALGGASPADRSEAIDIALEGTPPESQVANAAPEARTADALPPDGLPTEELVVEFNEEFENSDAEITQARPPSVQADTVRVRVIRYRPFPRWALVVAASLVVFAISLVVLRSSLPGESARAARQVMASEVPAASPAQHPSRTAFPASNTAVAPAPPAVPPPARSGAPSDVPQLAAAVAPVAMQVDAPSPKLAPTATSAPVRPAAPASKTPTSPSKRRAGAQDFFRDPGF